MKVRVFKKPDGSAVCNYPSPNYQDKLDKCRVPEDLKDLPFIVAEDSEIPRCDSSTGDYPEMLYFDGDCEPANLKQDREWNVCLMPSFLIRQKHIARLNERLDAELAKGSAADPVEVIRCIRQKEKCAGLSDKDWLEQALMNLNARVAGDEPDKPVIREKLVKKLKGFQ